MSLNIISSSGSGLDLHDSRELRFPFVAVFDQFLFVVEKLFVQECCVLKVWSFDDCVYGASFLAEAAENALGHVDIVFSSAAGAIGSGLTFDFDCEGWAGSFTKFTCDATFLTSWIPSKSMLATEHR